MYAVAQRKPEKIQACQDLNPDFCDTSAALKGFFFATLIIISCDFNCNDLYLFRFIHFSNTKNVQST